jgi:hypothetical protein
MIKALSPLDQSIIAVNCKTNHTLKTSLMMMAKYMGHTACVTQVDKMSVYHSCTWLLPLLLLISTIFGAEGALTSGVSQTSATAASTAPASSATTFEEFQNAFLELTLKVIADLTNKVPLTLTEAYAMTKKKLHTLNVPWSEKDVKQRLLVSWPKRIATKLLPHNPQSNATDFERLFEQQSHLLDSSRWAELTEDILLVTADVLHELLRQSPLGPVPNVPQEHISERSPVQSSHDIPLNDWHDLMLVLGEFHPWLLDLVKHLCPWYSATPVAVKTPWLLLGCFNGVRWLTHKGFDVGVYHKYKVDFMRAFMQRATYNPHFRLASFAVYFAVPGLHITWQIAPDDAYISKLASDNYGPQENREWFHDKVRIRNTQKLFACPAPPLCLSFPSDGMIPGVIENIQPVVSAIKEVIPSEELAARLIVGAISSRYVDWSWFQRGRLQPLYERLPPEAKLKGADISQLTPLSLKEGSNPYLEDTTSIIGLVVSIPGHSIGWLFDFHRRHLYITNRGAHCLLPGVLRYRLERIPSEEDWKRLHGSGQQLTIEEHNDLLRRLVGDPKVFEPVRYLSTQRSGNCHMRAHLELLRIVLAILLQNEDEAREMYRQIMSKAFELEWDFVAQTGLGNSDSNEFLKRAMASALIAGHRETFEWYTSSAGKVVVDQTALPMKGVPLTDSYWSNILIEQRKHFFLKYERLNAESFHSLNDTEHMHATLGIADVLVTDVTTSEKTALTVHKRAKAKFAKLRQNPTLGDDYLQFAVDNRLNPNAKVDPYFVVLGMLLLDQTVGLIAYVDSLDDTKRELVGSLSRQWKGYTLFDALIYGQLTHSTSPVVTVDTELFMRLYHLQYGTINDWARYANVGMLADNHHSHIVVKPYAIEGWTLELILCALAVFNQQPRVRKECGMQMLLHIRMSDAFQNEAAKPKPASGDLFVDQVLPALSDVDLKDDDFKFSLQQVRKFASDRKWFKRPIEGDKALFAKDATLRVLQASFSPFLDVKQACMPAILTLLDYKQTPKLSNAEQLQLQVLAEILMNAAGDLRVKWGDLAISDVLISASGKSSAPSAARAILNLLRDKLLTDLMDPATVNMDRKEFDAHFADLQARLRVLEQYASFMDNFSDLLLSSMGDSSRLTVRCFAQRIHDEVKKAFATDSPHLTDQSPKAQLWLWQCRELRENFPDLPLTETDSFDKLLSSLARQRIVDNLSALFKTILSESGDVLPHLQTFAIRDLDDLKLRCPDLQSDTWLANSGKLWPVEHKTLVHEYVQASGPERLPILHRLVVDVVLSQTLLRDQVCSLKGLDDWVRFVTGRYPANDPYGVVKDSGFQNARTQQSCYDAYAVYLQAKLQRQRGMIPIDLFSESPEPPISPVVLFRLQEMYLMTPPNWMGNMKDFEQLLAASTMTSLPYKTIEHFVNNTEDCSLTVPIPKGRQASDYWVTLRPVDGSSVKPALISPANGFQPMCSAFATHQSAEVALPFTEGHPVSISIVTTKGNVLLRNHPLEYHSICALKALEQ